MNKKISFLAALFAFVAASNVLAMHTKSPSGISLPDISPIRGEVRSDVSSILLEGLDLSDFQRRIPFTEVASTQNQRVFDSSSLQNEDEREYEHMEKVGQHSQRSRLSKSSFVSVGPIWNDSKETIRRAIEGNKRATKGSESGLFTGGSLLKSSENKENKRCYPEFFSEDEEQLSDDEGVRPWIKPLKEGRLVDMLEEKKEELRKKWNAENPDEEYEEWGAL